MNPDEIVYSINVSDLQHVSARLLDRKLSDDELKTVADAVGDFIDWTQAIKNAIETRLLNASNHAY